MLKKVLTLMLAVMMILGLFTVTAFAEGNPNDATLTGNTVTIGKTYKLENADTISPAETFYLLQTGKTSAESSVTGEDIPDLVAITDAGYTGSGKLVGKTMFAEGAASVAGMRQDIEIELPAYTAVGIYTYTLHEVDNATAGVTYWNNDIVLVITVMTNDDGTFYVEAVHCEERIADAPADEQPAKSDNFTNVYKAANDLSFAKTVSGNLGDRDKYFDFTVTFTGETGKDYSDATTVTVSGGSHTSNPVTVDITSGSATVNFKLKHGETLHFCNIPYGMTYAYSESDYSSDGYATTYPQVGTGVISDETGKEIMADDVSGTINFASKSYTVNNEKNGEIDTGIILDNLPYMMALAVVLIGGIVFFVSKNRKKAEDRV